MDAINFHEITNRLISFNFIRWNIDNVKQI